MLSLIVTIDFCGTLLETQTLGMMYGVTVGNFEVGGILTLDRAGIIVGMVTYRTVEGIFLFEIITAVVSGKIKTQAFDGTLVTGIITASVGIYLYGGNYPVVI